MMGCAACRLHNPSSSLTRATEGGHRIKKLKTRNIQAMIRTSSFVVT
jgi:hypothetical protein